MNPDYIEDRENLYRAISDQPSHWKPNIKKPSSAIFKDKRGVSVDREGGRNLPEIENIFEERKPGNGLCYILAEKCREIGTHPIPKRKEDNEFHAEIHHTDTEILIPQIIFLNLPHPDLLK